MEIWIYTIISVIFVSAISLIGVFTLSFGKEKLTSILSSLVSFAVGGLFGDVFIHLLPEIFERLGTNVATSLYIISGILIFFVLEKFIRWRHCHVLVSEDHPHPVTTINIIGSGAHNFFDGVLIAASYMISIPIGLATTLAVILHEIPDEIGHFAVLVYGGFSTKKALLFNFFSGITAVLGALISLLVGPHVAGYSLILLPITAGGFVYVAGSDLIPELQHEVRISTSLKQFIAMILGISIMAFLSFLS